MAFGRPLIRGDDLKGVASRPAFAAVGVCSGVVSAAVPFVSLGA
ncbi:hypothetical protein [Halobaculum rubrum]|nr:hypothetical protein [Halobaculum rubrum]